VTAPRPCSARESCGYSRRVLRVSTAHLILVMSVHLAALDHGVMDPALAPGMRSGIHGHLGATVLSAFPTLVPQHHGAPTPCSPACDDAGRSESSSSTRSGIRSDLVGDTGIEPVTSSV
jgi:hypothetical protein